MGEIFDFQAALSSKQEEVKESQELNNLKEHFQGLISDMTQSEITGLIEAIMQGDHDKYFTITNPLILRRAIREFNT
ncbi:hypothetical protein M2277_005651 [Paenibacillus sp. LBL]|uniref:hypothetical protein n=1 Tax=Paenibacillus sp. LBL TaxID=2940563 RepID=UPI0024735ECC|nr:hypothetical protein [Paenibacillus sp. LBL]MDH6674952.1 hypothetical protein [Paenibacillus sp. LBL]